VLAFASLFSSLTILIRGRVNAVALHHYVEFYDFAGLRLDHAFRFVPGLFSSLSLSWTWLFAGVSVPSSISRGRPNKSIASCPNSADGSGSAIRPAYSAVPVSCISRASTFAHTQLSNRRRSCSSLLDSAPQHGPTYRRSLNPHVSKPVRAQHRAGNSVADSTEWSQLRARQYSRPDIRRRQQHSCAIRGQRGGRKHRAIALETEQQCP